MSAFLTRAELRLDAPSVYAGCAYPKVSKRYHFIPTTDIVERLALIGWFPVFAQETRVRRLDRFGYSKHLVRFRRMDGALPMVGDTIPEIVLVNSHDGSCSYVLYIGLFRRACLNGMVIPYGKAMNLLRRRHSGTALDDVIEGTCEIVEELPAIAAKVETFSETHLGLTEQHAYGAAALALRWGSAANAPVTPEQIIAARRSEDEGDTLWSLFQRVQENLTKGGLEGRAKTGRRLTTRAITAVNASVEINKGLWFLTEQTGERKAAA